MARFNSRALPLRGRLSEHSPRVLVDAAEESLVSLL